MKEAAEAYWRANVRLVLILLAVWFAVSYGAGILLVDVLDRVTPPGTGVPQGFWFAPQGSIYGFVVLILVYVFHRNSVDLR